MRPSASESRAARLQRAGQSLSRSSGLSDSRGHAPTTRAGRLMFQPPRGAHAHPTGRSDVTVTRGPQDMHNRALAMTIAAACAAAAMTMGTLAPASGDEGDKVQFTDTSPVNTVAKFSAAYAPDFSRCTFNNVGNVVSPCVVPVTPVFEPSPG